ncbi:uncharacterized protein BKA55DRAFT_256203 [Fusarium redolens]|uniref:Uncharacterized protein n=1 Tax=Fusarium redolens TaxID=48865 RepID=A0A9P9FYD2_FUSRE|nr:uncharacterized protein BKA55DRAFT_256203 [Fusarium redolens]KAH7213389.1 hypothetical protein BKA55DRAFT_256203 [Fusarium redolens]
MTLALVPKHLLRRHSRATSAKGTFPSPVNTASRGVAGRDRASTWSPTAHTVEWLQVESFFASTIFWSFIIRCLHLFAGHYVLISYSSLTLHCIHSLYVWLVSLTPRCKLVCVVRLPCTSAPLARRLLAAFCNNNISATDNQLAVQQSVIQSDEALYSSKKERQARDTNGKNIQQRGFAGRHRPNY